MSNIDTAYAAFVATIRASLLDEVVAEVRARLKAEMSAESVALGKRLITKRAVWEKLGISEDTLDVLRREEKDFPKPKLVRGRLQWREHEIDRYIDQP